MIIPISLAEGKVRRLPWICIALLAGNLVVFVVLGLPAITAEREQAHALQQIYEYWKQRPYLQLPPEFMEAVVSQEEREEVALLIERIKAMVPGGEAVRQLHEQRELDQLIESFLVARANDSYRELGLIPARPTAMSFLTSMFMHAGWLHLLGNLLLLYLTGPFLEDVYGRIVFPFFYLAAGVVASLAHIAAYPYSDVPLVGASGAIAGLMGAFLLRFARAKIRFFYWFVIFVGTFSAPAWIMLVLWIGEQFLLASLFQDQGGVAYLAHIGGFGFGVIVAVFIGALRIEEKFIHPKIEARISITQDPALEKGLTHLAQGETLAARAAIEELLAREPQHPDAHLAMWESYVADGTPEEGVRHMEQVIESELGRGEVSLALDRWEEMSQRSKDPGSASLRWRLADRLQGTIPDAAIGMFENLARDAGSGMLAGKAATRLFNLARTPAERQRWQELVDATTASSAEHLDALAAANGPVAPLPVRDVHPPAGPAAHVPPAGYVVESSRIERLTAEAVMLRGETGGTPDALFYGNIAAVAVAGISGGDKPFLLVDLILAPQHERPRTVLRLLSTQLNPQQLTGLDLAAMDAFRELVRRIAAAASAPVIPEAEFVAGAPVSMYLDIKEYERHVLSKLA